MERRASLHVGREEDPGAVLRELEVAHVVVERGREVALRSGRAVPQDDPEPVGLVAGRELAREGEEAAVRGVARGAVEALVRRREVPRGGERRRVARDRDGPDVRVRRERRVRVAVRGERELLPVRREIEAAAPSHGEGRRVEVAGRQVADRLARVGLGEVEEEDVRPRAVLPVRPVAVEEGVGEVRLDLVRLPRVGGLLVAGGVGAAGGDDVGGEDDEAAVLREPRASRFRRGTSSSARPRRRRAAGRRAAGRPTRVETNASVLPSGEKKGCSSRASPAVSGRASFPSASTRQSATVFFFAAQSFVATV